MARDVLVEADNETQARELGQVAIQTELGEGVPVKIRTVRPATDDEIELMRWHHEAVANEAGGG